MGLRSETLDFENLKLFCCKLQITYNSIFCVSLEFQITNMDSECPVCKTTKYRNPSMQMLVNVCGHGLCSSCVETLFARGSGSCPECDVPLRRVNFKIQLFEDASIDKEVEIRRRVLRDFCRTQEDFESLREWNDYLEQVEDIIFNLVNNIDKEETEKMIAKYAESNKAFIKKNKHKMSAEYLELEDILTEEKRMDAKRKQENAIFEEEGKKAKVRDKERLIDDLMFSDKNSKEIIDEHKKNAQFSSAADFMAAKKDNSKRAPVIIEAKPYIYEDITWHFEGPKPPTNEEDIDSNKFNRHVRPAEEWERAAGYVESIGALRALQEAMS